VRRLLPLVLLALIPAPATALADGCAPSSCGSTGSAMPGSRTLFVRPEGQQGPLQAFDVFTGAHRYTLPRGYLSANGKVFVSSAQAKTKRTTVVRFDTRTGRISRGWSVPGRWNAAGVSMDGRRIALAQYRRGATVLEVSGSRSVLRGNVEVEALSPDGRRLFLIHWRRSGYDLQQLDLLTRVLSPTRLDEPDEKMSGTAWTAVATRDGRWLLTLYLKADGTSFVHALDLERGIAHCIDLPLRGEAYSVGMTSLTLSPDERRLYLASPWLGRVTTVDLETKEVTRVARFRWTPTSTTPAKFGPNGAVTANGRMLAFSGGARIWLYDTAFGIVRRAPVRGGNIVGLGFRPDGRSLLALRAGANPVALDAATGKRLR
jgi:hypothetical protein